MEQRGIIHRYRRYLPVTDATPVVSLGEGATPLIHACTISGMLGPGYEVYLKYEGTNPTGSFKDRGMTMAISKACEEQSRAVICASTGNTSASAAAYAAKAGLRCIVLIPSGAIALGKLSQALIHGARVLAIDGNFDAALALVREITATYPITLVNSLNPYRIEGQKTASFEICDALGDAPDIHCIPVGNAGNITAYWKGYTEYRAAGKAAHRPVMWGFQAAGAAPIVKKRPIKNPTTIATAIRIGNPASWKLAEAARDESGGCIDSVTDTEILRAYRLLAQKEGVFVEPASAASVAGLLKCFARGKLRGALKRKKAAGRVRIVCTLTGHGLKDPDRAIKDIRPPKKIKPHLNDVIREIGL